MCKVREEGGIRDKGEFFTCVIIWMVASPVEIEEAGVLILGKRMMGSTRASKI